jgi:class 3 adenylate cyclase
MSKDPENAPNASPGAVGLSAEDSQAAPEQKGRVVVSDATKQITGKPSLLSRFTNIISSVGVRYKIAGTFVIILSLAVVSLGVVTFTRQNSLLRDEMKSRASILANLLANVGKEGLLTKQEMPVYSTITDVQKRDGVVYAMVIDYEGRVFAHSDMSKKGSVLAGPEDKAALKAEALVFQETSFDGNPVLDASIPIVLTTKNLKLGVARIGLSERALNEAIDQQKIIYLWVALGFVVGGLIGSFALARVLTKGLNSLAEGMQVVARGDLRKLVPVQSNDEIGKLTNVFNQMILSLREKLLMEKYLSQSTVLSIQEHRDVTKLRLGGERKYVTALFSDARGFTSLSEKMSPEDVVGIMNVYLNLQTTVIHNWGGIVDKFMGDEVMAIFEGRGMEINAVRAAVEIQMFCTAMNAVRASAGEKQISIGIGLNSGDVVMGNMGSEDHMDYTVIGDNINVAARLCGIAQPGQVLVSKIVADEIGDRATWKELEPVMVKGRDHPIGIAEVVSITGGARQYMRKTMDVSVTYSLEGFTDEANTAIVKNISGGGCLLEVGSPIGIGSKLNIKLNLVDLGNITVRATVYHARKQSAEYYVGLCFEDIPDEARNSIVQWIHRVNLEIGEGLLI